MLPKIQQPIFTLNLPISKKTIKYRPMLVKEEKMLLMAKESADLTDIINNLEQVINNCILDDIDINQLPMVEVEYIFVNLRGKSIGNIIELKFTDEYNKKKAHGVTVDVDQIKINIPENYQPKIQINDSLGVILKPPTLFATKNLNFKNTDAEIGTDLISKCIESVYTNDEVYNASEYTQAELLEFVEGLTINALKKIESFFENLPKMYYKIQYKNTKDEDVVHELTRLDDFF